MRRGSVHTPAAASKDARRLRRLGRNPVDGLAVHGLPVVLDVGLAPPFWGGAPGPRDRTLDLEGVDVVAELVTMKSAVKMTATTEPLPLTACRCTAMAL